MSCGICASHGGITSPRAIQEEIGHTELSSQSSRTVSLSCQEEVDGFVLVDAGEKRKAI